MKTCAMMVATALPLVTFAAIMGDLPDASHAWAVHDPNRPRPKVVCVDATGVPSDAIVLLDGSEETYRTNWVAEKDGGPSPWKQTSGEIVSCSGSIRTVREFGDCQVHVEWCAPDDENPQHGNSGVYLMGLYEVQIINSHEVAPGSYHKIVRSADEQAASVYGQKPPLVNPIRKPGEWQTYDIVFHQPIHDVEGRLVHPGTLTVFFNGVLVQDNREIEGPTYYCRRSADKVHAERGPLQLQDHDGNVHFRNIWIRELTSPWKEDLVSGTSAVCRKAVVEQRMKSAQMLLEGLSKMTNNYDRLVSALEMLTYSTDRKFLDAATKLADAEADALPHLDAATHKLRVSQLKWYFDKMSTGACLPADWKLIAALKVPRCRKISVFANAIQSYAKAHNKSLGEVSRMFYDVGIRGFDCDYTNTNLLELAKGPLLPINLFGRVNFAAPDNGRAQSEKFVAQAVKCGVPCIMVIPNDFSRDGNQEAEFVETVKGLRYLAQKATASGVRAMVEDYGGDANPCSHIKYLKRYLEEIPELSYALDSGNLHYAGRGEDVREMMRFAKGRIAHVHLKDFQKGSNRIRTTIGIGEIPNEEIVRTMNDEGYDDFYTLEDLVGDSIDDAQRQIGSISRWCVQ